VSMTTPRVFGLFLVLGLLVPYLILITTEPMFAIAVTVLGALLGLGLAAVTQGIFDPDFKAVDWPVAISMFPTAMLPTLICWYPVRNRYYLPPGSGARAAESTT
jgi:hypothetical protein